MTLTQRKAIARLMEMNAEVLSKAIPTGVTMVDGIPAFKYNKTTTKILEDINALRFSILNPKETAHGSSSK